MSFDPSLNPEQERAVRTTEGPVLIVAGAGSGKTKTLTHRIVHLMREKRVPARNILAVTFTNKAAGEMRERVRSLLSAIGHRQSGMKNQESESGLPMTDYGLREEDPRLSLALPHIGTFHSISARILRRDIALLGYKPSFSILDADDQLALMKRVMKALEIDPKQIHPRALLETVSRAKNRLVDELAFEASAGSHFEAIIARAYRRYQEELRGNHALDFDDLLILVLRLFREYPEALERYRRLYRYLLVDEYQDTNRVQYEFLHSLAEHHRNLFAIGDDYQSIYGWRQADIRNILNFEKDYPEAAVITLDQNYRSTQTILDAAGAVIEKNAKQRHKKLWTAKKGGEKIVVFEAEDEVEEANFVAWTVSSLVKTERRPFADFAVLYRTNAQSRALEEALLKRDIPYHIVGGLKFYQRKEVKDAIAYLRLAANPADTLSLARIVNEPARGIGKKSLVLWLERAKSAATDPIAFALEATSKKADKKAKETPESTLPGTPAKQETIRRFAQTLRECAETLAQPGALSAFLPELLSKAGYLDALEDGTEEGKTRLENVQELISVAKKFDTLPKATAAELLLEEVSLISDADTLDETKNAVRLMTVHSAKGLEFPVVLMTGLEEGVFPHSRSTLSPADLEEERRLMYVGLTRAKERLYLVSAETRLIFGSTQMNAPSRFLGDIPEPLVREASPTERGRRERKSGDSLAHFPEKSPKKHFSTGENDSDDSEEGEQKKETRLRPGDSVAHPVFGNGVVVSVDGTLASIAFRKSGIKKLVLGIAPIKRM